MLKPYERDDFRLFPPVQVENSYVNLFTLSDTATEKEQYTYLSGNKKKIPALCFPWFHGDEQIIHCMQQYLSLLTKDLYSKPFRKRIAMKVEDAKYRSMLLKDDPSETRNNVYTFYVKGGSALRLIIDYYFFVYHDFIVDKTTGKRPFRFESDWDTNLLINPDINFEDFQIIRGMVIEKVIDTLMVLASDKSSVLEGKMYELLKNGKQSLLYTLLREKIASIDQEILQANISSDVEKLKAEKLSYQAFEKCSFFVENTPRKIYVGKFGEEDTISGINYAPFYDLENPPNTSKIVRFNPEVSIEETGSKFFLGRLMIRFHALHPNGVNATEVLPFELIDVSVPTYDDTKLRLNWETHKNEIHITWNNYDFYTWTPFTNYLDIRRMVWERNIGISDDPKTDKRAKRGDLLKEKILKPYIFKDPIVSDNLVELGDVTDYVQSDKYGRSRLFDIKKELKSVLLSKIAKDEGELYGKPFGAREDYFVDIDSKLL